MASQLEYLIGKFREALGDDSVMVLHGRANLERQDQVRRVVWVAPGGTISSPTTTEMRMVTGAQVEGQRVKPLASKRLSLIAFVQAEDFETLEDLHENVLVAAHSAWLKASTAGAFDIITQGDERFGFSISSELIAQRFELDLVLAKERKTLATLTTQTHECSIDTEL